MQNKNEAIFISIMMEDIELPKALRNFLKNDDLGIDGLDFMISDENLFSRIPKDVRQQYEIIYANLDNKVTELALSLRELADHMEENPKEIIHRYIQDVVDDDE